MATTPTQLPIPSEKPQDLKFNAGKIDEFVTSMGWTYTDRFGVKHYTIEGVRHIAELGFSAQLLSQEQRFNLFIQNSGYEVIGDYEDGPVTITEYNQLIRYDGELWKIIAATDIPFTTTGNNASSWIIDSAHLVSVGDAALRQNLYSDEDGLGDELLTVNQPYSGAVGISQHDQNKGWVSILNFGAKCDGVTDDTAAAQKAILACGEAGVHLFVPGVSVISEELYIRKPIKIFGTGPGTGYGPDALVYYKQRSGFLVKSEIPKRLRTRVSFRASSASPEDAALSVALNVQAEDVTLVDFSIFLDFDRTNSSPTLTGPAVDVGIFLGCRVQFTMERVHVLGYWREASCWFDFTNGYNSSTGNGYMPRFPDPTGVRYEDGTVTGGGDGCKLTNCFTKGGKWGIKVQGAHGKDGNIGYADDYYDGQSNALIYDNRGGFGFSDFNLNMCRIYGPEHHSRYRIYGRTGNYLTDPGGGAMVIDGIGGARSSPRGPQGMRFFSTRFTSGEAFRVRLVQVNRAVFYGCHHEIGSVAYNADGTTVSTDTYGPITTTVNCASIYTQNTGSQSVNYDCIANRDEFTNVDPHSTDRQTQLCGVVNVTDGLRNRYPGRDLKLYSPAGQSVRAYSYDDATASYLTTFVANANGMVLYRAALYPLNDNYTTNGRANQRWTQVYAVNSTISTSDATMKTQPREVTLSEVLAFSLILRLPGVWQWLEKYRSEGDNARIHSGPTVQAAISIMEANGLDWTQYSAFCFDKWEAKAEEKDERGEVITPAIEAGEIYSFRKEELTWWCMRAIAYQFDDLSKRVSVLESR